ncbi:MAG TPA: TadE/TadG family type IV pilus assembly protein [Candidatus Eisenbacteria bacterium]|nr:TadE/TadG family type IV pilus assembly protein [Candidatus Eisenbacteria bacterium]
MSSRRGRPLHPSLTPERRSESGTALIEFAFVLPILLVLAMGMLDFGRAFHMKSLLDQAAREGARVAVVTSPDVDIVESRVDDVLASGGIAPTSVTVDGPDAAQMVTVTVNATFTFITPGVFALLPGWTNGNTIPMSGQTVMRFEG